MESRAKSAPSNTRTELLRQIPGVDELLAQPALAALSARVGRGLVVDAIREVLGKLRQEVARAPESASASLDPTAITERVITQTEHILGRSLQPVINAAGVILHTNLGRAPLTEAVVEQFRQTVTQYSNLEYDLEEGERGKRDVHTARLLKRLTGAEAAIVVNNCAAAVLLALTALAKCGEAIVSRGELIEIGDGFRIPEIMAESGAVLREVGTTNRTRIADYENAIGENTRVLLRVHPSNFTITGFAEKPSLEELVALSRRTGLPLIEDLGSGCLTDLSANGIAEPLVRQSIEAGVSVVTFSGDKLLGGPQAGILAGNEEIISRVRKHPLFRALRVDKLTITALETTLRAYLRGALDEIPALRMIRMSAREVEQRAEKFLNELRVILASGDVGSGDVEAELAEGVSVVGGGSTPAQALASKVIRIASARYSATQLEQRLRSVPETPVIARVEEKRLILDLRTVFPEQDAALLAAVANALK